MRETRERSLFLAGVLLAAVLVAGVGLALAFFPLMTCNVCLGMGTLTKEEHQEVIDFLKITGEVPRAFKCGWCSGWGRVTPRRRWTMELPDAFRLTARDKAAIIHILEKREASE